MRTMEYKIGFIKSTFEWRAESFLFNLGKSTKRCDDFVAVSIQFTTEDNVVVRVRQQMLDHKNVDSSQRVRQTVTVFATSINRDNRVLF